jgi:hypothetical protein
LRYPGNVTENSFTSDNSVNMSRRAAQTPAGKALRA